MKNPDDEEVRKGRPTVYDTWLERDRSPVDKQKPNIPVVGSDSDFAPFVCRVGVSSVDLRFTFDRSLNISSYPLYHSAYETPYYYETFIDPGFKVSLYAPSFVVHYYTVRESKNMSPGFFLHNFTKF